MVGKVTVQSKKLNSVRWVVQDVKNLNILCALFNGNLVLPARREDLKRFFSGMKAFKNKPRKRAYGGFVFDSEPLGNVPKFGLNDGWLCGFSDGEACFHARVHARNVRFEFSISQTGCAKQVLETCIKPFQWR